MEAMNDFHDLVAKGHSPQSAKAIVDRMWQSSSPDRFPGVAPRQSLLPDDILKINPMAIGAGGGRGGGFGSVGAFKSAGDFISQFRLLSGTPGVGLDGAKAVLGQYGEMYGIDVNKLGGREDWTSLFNDANGNFSGEKFRAAMEQTRGEMQRERWDPEGDIPLEGVMVPHAEVMDRVIGQSMSLLDRKRKDPFRDNPEAADLHNRLKKPFEFMGPTLPGNRLPDGQVPGQVWPPTQQQPPQQEQPAPRPEDVMPGLGTLGVDPVTQVPLAQRQSIDGYYQQITEKEQAARQNKMWYSEGDLAKRKNIRGRIETIRDNVIGNGGNIRPRFAMDAIIRELDKLKQLTPETPQLTPANRS
jgi:hypothetical protein